MARPRPAPSWRIATSMLIAAIAFSLTAVTAVTAAFSDTPNPPTTTTATVVGASPPQVAVAPNGPLNGLGDGTTVTVTVSGPAGKFFGSQARLCKGGVNISFDSQYRPTQGGNCINAPFDAQSDAVVEVSAAPTNDTITFDFHVGTGTQSFQANQPTTITCDATHPCSLWLRESVDTSLNPTGTVFVHYDLNFGAGPVPTTTTTTSTVPVSTTTTTTASTVPVSTTTTTSTVPGSTTTTSTVAGSTTTSSSSTVASSTTSSSVSHAPSSPTGTAADPPAGSLGVTGAPVLHLLWSGWALLVAGALLAAVAVLHRRTSAE